MLIVFARSRKRFETALGHLATIAPDEFMKYYNKNWGKSHQIKYWAFYKTIQHINLGNTTNNRLESHNQKLKDVLSSYMNMTLPESVRNVLMLYRGKVEEMTHAEFNQKFKTPYRLANDDLVVYLIVKSLTPYAAGIVVDELKKARQNCMKYNTLNWSCPLKISMLLPCRHLFASRLNQQSAVLFEATDAGER